MLMKNLIFRRRRLLALSIFAALLAALFVPLPLKPNDKDIEFAVSHALTALLQDQKAWTSDGYTTLPDSGFVKVDGRLYFENDTNVPEQLFLKHSLNPIPKDLELDVNDGDVIVLFSFTDDQGRRTERLQFSYIYGSLGAQGFEIRIYKSALLRFVYYSHQWVS